MSQDQPNTFDKDLDLYTLDEACVKSRTSIASIIKTAADGRISLYTTIPIGWEVFSIDIIDLPACEYKENTFINLITHPGFNRGKRWSLEHADPSIELLKLSTLDCTTIKTRNQYHQCVFSSGLKTSHNHPPLTVTPKTKNDIDIRRISINFFGESNRCFVVCKKPNLRDGTINSNINLLPYGELEITQSMLRVAHNDLEKLSLPTNSKLQNTTEENNQEYCTTVKQNSKKYPKNISHRLYTPGRARTKLLETLYRAAKHSWEIRIATGKYPKQENIKHLIMRTCPQCAESLAQKMATIISPCAEDIESESDFFLTNQFWALIDTYEKFYLNAERGRINKKEILRHLQHHPHLLSVTTPASQIIDPNFKANVSPPHNETPPAHPNRAPMKPLRDKPIVD
ncbi:hypothetical protein ACLIKD_03480 [Azonexus sp. IMCC34842]|uniref:hypothetical protein n=1 Tax=Azonexus sp. IMCC34842 TaxID=3420950 RepID=UPI003D116C07